MGKALKRAIAKATDSEGEKRKGVRLIRPTVSIHDRTQIEMLFSYAFGDKKQIDDRKQWDFEVDAYMFLAPQMRITQDSYPKERFYEDLQVFLRLREPKLNFKQLMGIGRKGRYSPLRFVRSYVEKAQSGLVAEDPALVVEEAKVFGCCFMSYFLRRVEKHKKRHQLILNHRAINDAKRDKFHAEAMAETLQLVDRAHALLKEWRAVLGLIDDLPGDFLVELRRVIRTINEYCSYGFRDGLLQLDAMLDELQENGKSEGGLKLRKKLKTLLRHERWYAYRVGISWIQDGDSRDVMERYVLRRSELKRHIWRVLYLNVRSTKIFRVQRQIGAMVAAALAGMWAFIAQLIIWNTSSFDGYGGQMEGISAFLIVTAFVMAYVLKDRIKELGRSYFQSGLFGSVPDFSNRIYFVGQKAKTAIGDLREKVQVTSWSTLPEYVRELHDEHLGVSLDVEDRYANIIHYRKQIGLDMSQLQSQPQPVPAVHDIIRINIHSFLQKLDDPTQKSVIASADFQAISADLPKVYPLDLVLRYSATAPGVSEVGYDVIRLFLNKDGLARVEQSADSTLKTL